MTVHCDLSGSDSSVFICTLVWGRGPVLIIVFGDIWAWTDGSVHSSSNKNSKNSSNKNNNSSNNSNTRNLIAEITKSTACQALSLPERPGGVALSVHSLVYGH